MTFRVGQKVCCVEGAPDWGIFTDKIYTISAIGFFGRKLHVDLVEVKNEHPLGWRANRFRPIVERKTSIEIFQRMLLPQGENA